MFRMEQYKCLTNNSSMASAVFVPFYAGLDFGRYLWDYNTSPPGDSYTRCSMFDSILAGCIPVFFHPYSAHAQYIWYFPKNYTSYSVYIPANDIKHGSVSINESLSRFLEHRALAMRKEVVKLIPKVIWRPQVWN
ncbi:hypothetical protein J1N35_037855 [Gossypium stocksii]|uniref:Exostosin GT47 domain-containing protein n=1 Tax=Gossypium stocksii TaxID=47602 RepID=A0A9D3ZLB4_9ROSI|nr:hypothetical protein J1N35_037855 [Gossypium stocksii]